MVTPFNIVWTGEQYRVSIPNYDGGTVVTMEDHEAALEAKEQEINKLTKECEKWRNKAWDYEEEVGDVMKQAVQFAELLIGAIVLVDCHTTDQSLKGKAFDDPGYKEAKAFLNSSEVQAWRKEQKW